MMKQTRPTLDAPYYVDGVGVLRCHFCLCVQAVGHLAKCPVRVEQDRQLLESARHVASRSTNDDAVNPQPSPKGPSMRFLDLDTVGVYLDTFSPRVVRAGETESKLLDLTLRIQPFTPELAVALDPDVRPLLFNLTDASPKPKIKSMELKLVVPKQDVTVHLVPEVIAQMALFDVEVSGIRARTEKGVDGYALVFYATVGPLGEHERALIADWHTQQRFLTFKQSQSVLDFAGTSEEAVNAAPPRKARKASEPAIEAGDELRPGVLAEH